MSDERKRLKRIACAMVHPLQPHDDLQSHETRTICQRIEAFLIADNVETTRLHTLLARIVRGAIVHERPQIVGPEIVNLEFQLDLDTWEELREFGMEPKP